MIRAAGPNDSKTIAPLLLMAMEELAAKYVNAQDPQQAIPLFEHFVSLPGNQYSFENMKVYVEHDIVLGVISGYDGDNFQKLRAPFLVYLKQHHDVDASSDDETQVGEYYIDALSVSTNVRGKGIGKKLIAELIEEAGLAGYKKIGLLVNLDNQQAIRLYEGLNFKIVGEKALLKERYHHMQFTV